MSIFTVSYSYRKGIFSAYFGDSVNTTDVSLVDLPEWSKNFSLSYRITLGVLLMFSLATLVLVWFISSTERSHSLAELQTRLVARSSFKALELQRAIDGLRRDVQFLSDTPPVQALE